MALSDNTILPGTGTKYADVDYGGAHEQIVRMKMADSEAVDAFGRLRVSNPVTLFDSQQQYDLGRLYWEDLKTGAGTTAHLPNESSINLAVGAASADTVIRQTREYFRYQPGKSQLIFMTAAFGPAIAGRFKRYGYYDADNGICFEQSTSGIYNVFLRSKVTGSVVDTIIPQTSWNIDNMDGVGNAANPSGHILDGTKAQIFVIDLQWLSVGRVRVGIELEGDIQYIHQFEHANIFSGAYMTTANLPCRYEIGGAVATATSFKTICTTVISEGGFEIGRGSKFATPIDTIEISVTTRRPILSIRPKALFNGIVNRGLILPSDFHAFSRTKEALIELVYGGALTGAVYSSVNADSITEYDTAATAISGGIVLDIIPTDKKDGGQIDVGSRFPLALNIAGGHPTTPYADCLTLVMTTYTTATQSSGSIDFREFR